MEGTGPSQEQEQEQQQLPQQVAGGTAAAEAGLPHGAHASLEMSSGQLLGTPLSHLSDVEQQQQQQQQQQLGAPLNQLSAVELAEQNWRGLLLQQQAASTLDEKERWGVLVEKAHQQLKDREQAQAVAQQQQQQQPQLGASPSIASGAGPAAPDKQTGWLAGNDGFGGDEDDDSAFLHGAGLEKGHEKPRAFVDSAGLIFLGRFRRH